MQYRLRTTVGVYALQARMLDMDYNLGSVHVLLLKLLAMFLDLSRVLRMAMVYCWLKLHTRFPVQRF